MSNASTPTGNQDIEAAVSELHRMVDSFKASWLAGHRANPEQYPLTMGDGDWFEAFLSSATTGEGL